MERRFSWLNKVIYDHYYPVKLGKPFNADGLRPARRSYAFRCCICLFPFNWAMIIYFGLTRFAPIVRCSDCPPREIICESAAKSGLLSPHRVPLRDQVILCLLTADVAVRCLRYLVAGGRYTAASLLYLTLYSNGDMPVIFLNTSRKAFGSE